MIIASWIPSLVINNCRFFVTHRDKEAGSLFADSPWGLTGFAKFHERF